MVANGGRVVTGPCDAQVRAGGGRVVCEPFDTDFGRMTILLDAESAPFAVIRLS